MSEYASKGVAGAALGTGIGGLALGVLNGGLGNLFNGMGCGNAWSGGNGCCNEQIAVNRYEAAQNAKIAELETAVALRDANTYSMTQLNNLRDYVDRRFDGVNAAINGQAVVNAQVAANLSCMQTNIASLMALTKTVVPITNICPEPMPLYNSWTAPTATT